MSRDLILLLIALALGVVVIVLGLRRNLSKTTREWLPRFGGGSEQSTATVGLYEGGNRPRQPPSPRQRRLMVSLYLLLALSELAFAVLSAHSRLFHAGLAAVWMLGVVVTLRRESPRAPDDFA